MSKITSQSNKKPRKNSTKQKKALKRNAILIDPRLQELAKERIKLTPKLSEREIDQSINTDGLVSLHAISFKIPVKKIPKNFKWDTTKQMRNWVKKIVYFPDATIQLTSKSIIISMAKDVYSTTPDKAYQAAELFCMQAVLWLEGQGFKFGSGHLTQVGKPHIVAPKKAFPSIAGLGKHHIIKSSDGKIVIDDSKGDGGEIEFMGMDAYKLFFKMVSDMKDRNGMYL
ncbi:hypothetical protein WKT22_04397 [Candidatus Lokiarchaeum ossiferum]